MGAVARRIVLVLLLTYVAITMTIVVEFVDVPRFPLCQTDANPDWFPDWLTRMIGGSDSSMSLACENGDIVALASLLAIVLIEATRKLRWVLAPALLLSTIHAVAEFRHGLPTQDYRTDWDTVGGAFLLYLSLTLIALTMFALVTGSHLAIRWILRRSRFDLAARVARLGVVVGRMRRVARIAAVVLILALLAWRLFTLSDAYQFASIRWEAAEAIRNGQSEWAAVAAETGNDVERTQAQTSAATLVALAKAFADTDAGEAYRRQAFDRALDECERSAARCEDLAYNFTREEWSAEAGALQRLAPLLCESGTASGQPADYARLANALRGCLRSGNVAAASRAWRMVLDLPSDSNAESIPIILAHIPGDTPLPPTSFVYRRAKTVRFIDDSERRGALFQGLLRAGRTDDAIAYLSQLAPGALDYQENYFDPPNAAPPIAAVELATDVLVRLGAVIRERYSSESDRYAAMGWRRQIAQRLAVAREPEAALAVLSLPDDADEKTIDPIVAALARQKRFRRAFETLDALDATSFQRSRGRLCLAMARMGEHHPCVEMVERLDYRDQPKFLVLAGRHLIMSNRRPEGERLVDRAESMTFGEGVDAELAAALANVGRLRLARAIADTLPAAVRAEVYRSAAASVNGWRRRLGILVGGLRERVGDEEASD